MVAAVQHVLTLLVALKILCSYTSVAQLVKDNGNTLNAKGQLAIIGGACTVHVIGGACGSYYNLPAECPSSSITFSMQTSREKGPPRYSAPSANVSRLIDSLITNYDKRLRPDYKGPPVEVDLSLRVSSISSISEVDMDFTLDMYFRQTWKDERLAFSDKFAQLCISNEMLDKIWWPDTFFANAKASTFHDTTTKNAFVRISSSGEITQSLRLTVTAMCNMNLMYFPMDSQLCTLEIESYGYDIVDIVYKWQNGSASVDISDDARNQLLPSFTVRDYRLTRRVVQLTTGTYSRMAVQFLFGRNMGYYLIQVFIPSTLIVVLSWVSFWISYDAVPARVALGSTTVLTMTTLISNTNAALPKVPYLKSIDIFLIVCFVMVFGSLLEYAAVSYLSSRPKIKVKKGKRDARKKKQVDIKETLGNGERYGYTAVSSMGSAQTECRIQQNIIRERGIFYTCCLNPVLIDQWSRIVFPLVFSIFQLVYWVVYGFICMNDADKTFRLVDHGDFF